VHTRLQLPTATLRLNHASPAFFTDDLLICPRAVHERALLTDPLQAGLQCLFNSLCSRKCWRHLGKVGPKFRF
jgi:hypothetical protein